MCGIAGLIETSGAVAPGVLSERLRSMMSLVEHRGPDDWGMTIFAPNADSARLADDERVSVAANESTALLGHRRLSIIDLSTDARQPMRSHDGRYWLIFNGEIYNYIELRNELEGTYPFRTHSDTEVILAAYERWGMDMLDRFDGMFAIVIFDARQRTLFCARDPLGIKPFYYAFEDGVFSFASETRAVLAGLGTRGRLDRTRTAEFLVLGVTDHDDGTCFEQVKQLPGGHALLLDAKPGAAPRIFQYWQPPLHIADSNGATPRNVYADVRNAVRWQLRSDVPVGSCLSGGLDSGAIAAAVGDILEPDARQRYSVLTLTNAGFEGDESRLASTTARHAGLSWVPVQVKPDEMIDDLQRMVAAHDQPFYTLSMFGQYCVMKRAHELGLKVMLDGQGGDEIFLGYERVAQRSVVQWARAGRIGHALSEWRNLQRNASVPMTSLVLANLAYAWPSAFQKRNRARMLPLADASLLDDVRPEIAEDMYGFRGDGIFGLQIRELLKYSLPKLLRFEDRNSMAFGVEARVPLLAKNVVTRALQLPLEWRVNGGWTKYALRKAVDPHLPPEIVWNRKKRGFEVPQRQWVEAIRPWLAAQLADLGKDAPIDVDGAFAMIDRGEGGQPYLWRAISVALWLRMNDVKY